MASLTLPPASSLRPDLSSTSPLFPFLRPLTGDLRQSIHRKKFLVPADEATVSRLVQHKRDAVASLNLKLIVCEARGPRPRFPRVWKTRKRIGTISKSQKLVGCIKGLSNVKEEVYGALDSFVAWELEFPLVLVKKALKTLEFEKEWKRIIQVIKWMFSKGQGKTMGTYYTLLNALAEDGRLEEAEELWMKIFNENLENLPRIFFMKMITLYYRKGMHEKMFEVFADMEELGIRPDQSIVSMLGDVFQKLGMVDKYDKLNKKYPPPTWEYRYFKGKRVRIPVKQIHGSATEACTTDAADSTQS
ncbi:pentatricopeptide repeat-containing protein At4g21190-like [Zingiber officinale]|uniref:pentatricopeptide repeat-containing protein At4g21190-like n=1 Tax=Zingiber officinale TaxID=94328 RepID=UPI001C4CD9E3|nr:pentatricopeptide repeat-containing protein At4g21190-like [Zingiber officinale]